MDWTWRFFWTPESLITSISLEIHDRAHGLFFAETWDLVER